MLTDDEDYARLMREKEERAKLPVKDETQDYLRLEAEKKSRAAISGYGVPRKDFSHVLVQPKKEIPVDIPELVRSWLEEKNDG